MRIRGASVVCLTTIAVLTVALPAAAKMPPWTCELSTSRPVVGEPVTVEVRYWWDADHTEPAEMAIFRRFRLVAVGIPDEGELGEIVPFTLRRVSRSAYRGEVTFPDAQRFRVAGCGGGYDRRGYPLERGGIIAPRESGGADPPSRFPATLPIGVVLVALLVGTLRLARSRATRTAEGGLPTRARVDSPASV